MSFARRLAIKCIIFVEFDILIEILVKVGEYKFLDMLYVQVYTFKI